MPTIAVTCWMSIKSRLKHSAKKIVKAAPAFVKMLNQRLVPVLAKACSTKRNEPVAATKADKPPMCNSIQALSGQRY